MKNVRVWFKKDFECRYISHLDLNRCMLRAVHKSKIPVWHTEGFNPHPFITFALPLSLGFRGERETMDMRLTEDFDFSEIAERLNSCLPKGIRVFDVTEPVSKPNKIAFALFDIKLTADSVSPKQLCSELNNLFSKEEILIDKKTKSGVKEVNIKSYLSDYALSSNDEYVHLSIKLPAGSKENVNPTLIINASEKYLGKEIYSDITRLDVLTEEEVPFE
ncbi:MAG: TIGR03936 family radical SAM-associated protein [Acutalibacteraceae bacterium]